LAVAIRFFARAKASGLAKCGRRSRGFNVGSRRIREHFKVIDRVFDREPLAIVVDACGDFEQHFRTQAAGMGMSPQPLDVLAFAALFAPSNL
jgi:hypothetical protein